MRLTTLAEKLSEASIRNLLVLKRRAFKVKGLKRQHDRLMQQAKHLERQISALMNREVSMGRARPKRRISAGARRRISIAQKKRWAAYRAKQGQGKLKAAQA